MKLFSPSKRRQQSGHSRVALAAMFLALGPGFSAPAVAQPDSRQSALLAHNCLQCHAKPETGAPLMGVAADWQKIALQGEDAMLKNVVQGIRGMPPLGYCSACSEEDLRVMIRLMTGLPDKQRK